MMTFDLDFIFFISRSEAPRPQGGASRIAETFPAYRRAGSLGENAFARQECPAYRVFEIAAFIPAPAYRPRSRTINRPRAGQAGTGRGILQHFRNGRL
jgi:hypothetical protein